MILTSLAERLKRRAKDDRKGRPFEPWLIIQAVSWIEQERLAGGLGQGAHFRLPLRDQITPEIPFAINLDEKRARHCFLLRPWAACPRMQPWPSPRAGVATVERNRSRLQLFWGHRARAAGVGEPKPDLSAEALAKAEGRAA